MFDLTSDFSFVELKLVFGSILIVLVVPIFFYRCRMHGWSLMYTFFPPQKEDFFLLLKKNQNIHDH